MNSRLRRMVYNNPAAVGSTSATATLLGGELNVVTGADGTKGVRLAAPVVGGSPVPGGPPSVIVNPHATLAVKVYPNTGGQIDALGTDTAFVLNAGQAVLLYPSSTTQWYSLGAITNLSPAELVVLDGVTAGTVAASKAAVVDANKDIGDFRNLRTVRVITEGGAPTSDNTVGNRTYTAAEILGGIIVRDPNGAGRSDVLPTAALLVAAIPGAKIGDVVSCEIINGADAAETITIGAGSGGGFDANQTASSRVITQNTSKTVFIRLTNVTPASEAYVAYM